MVNICETLNILLGLAFSLVWPDLLWGPLNLPSPRMQTLALSLIKAPRFKYMSVVHQVKWRCMDLSKTREKNPSVETSCWNKMEQYCWQDKADQPYCRRYLWDTSYFACAKWRGPQSFEWLGPFHIHSWKQDATLSIWGRCSSCQVILPIHSRLQGHMVLYSIWGPACN